MGRNWTDDQRHAIDARGGSVLVSAAAGSGKTAVLVERIITRITDEKSPVPADRLLVATFSSAAAGEMRERIENRLAELIREDRKNEFLLRQQALLNKARISTIHSFCLDLLRENADILDIDSAFRIADDAEVKALASEAVTEVLEDGYASDDGDFLRLSQMFSKKDDTPLAQLVQSIYGFIRSFPYPKDWLDAALKAYDTTDIDECEWKRLLTERAYDELMYCAGRMEFLAEKLTDAGELYSYYYDTFINDARIIGDLARFVQMSDWDEIVFAAGKKYFPALPRIKGCNDEQAKIYFQKKRDAVKKSVTDIMAKYFCETKDEFAEDMDYLRPVIARLFETVKAYYDRLDAKKAENSLLDFSDLELYSIKLLSEKKDGKYLPSETAKRMSEQFEEILLDEYQDTNAAQDMIFTMLSRNSGNIFTVGDVKQSIYGFRQAMPEIFMSRKNSYCEYDGKNYPARIDLSNNFRSRSQVTSFINFLFSQIMSARLGDVIYDAKECLYPKGEYFDNDSDSELCILDLSEISRDKQYSAEAEYIAGRISEMISQGYSVRGANGDPRPCTAGDFCILLRSVKNADRYVKALQQYGISACADNTESYFDTRETLMILNLLRIIDNPLDDVAFLSVILSPAFSFTADDAAQTRVCLKDAPFYLAFGEYAKQNPRASAFLQTLERLRKVSVLSGVGDLISEIYDTTDLFAAAGAMPSGERRQANLNLFRSTAVRYEQNSGSGLGGFIRYIGRMIERGEDLKGAGISGGSDVVSIMSIHRSKGLEFPVCIVAECAKQFNKQDVRSSTVLHRNYGFTSRVIIPERLKSYSTAYMEAVRQAVESDNLSEEMRVLYVALTRAKEKLIMTCAFKDSSAALSRILNCKLESGGIPTGMLKKAASYADWLIAAAVRHPNADELRRKSGAVCSGEVADADLKIIMTALGSAELKQVSESERVSSDEELVEQIRKECEYVYPYAELSECVSKLAVTRLAKQTAKSEIRLKARPDFIEREGMTAAERGTAAHKFMQFADFEAARQDLKSETERIEREGFLADYEVRSLNLTKLKRFFESGLMERILNADRVYREYSFFDEIPAADIYDGGAALNGEQVLVQGIADCVIIKDGAGCVIDYKTDYVKSEEELAFRYKEQLRIYAQALTKALGVPVTEKIIYSISLGKEISIE